MPHFPDLPLTRRPLSHYGSLEGMIRAIRAHNSLDLNAERWRQAHPAGSFAQWREQAKGCLLEGLHCDPGPVDLRPATLECQERDGFTLERVEFNTAPWSRVEGYFLLPTGVPYPVPDLTIMAAPGKHLVVNCSEDDLFPPEAQAEAARQIRQGYEWAGCPDHFGHYNPPKPHCYDAQIQAQALAWFDQHLKDI